VLLPYTKKLIDHHTTLEQYLQHHETTKRLAEASREPNGATPNPFLVTYHFTMKKLLYLELHYDVVFLTKTSMSVTPPLDLSISVYMVIIVINTF
jgi:hypothetical protein